MSHPNVAVTLVVRSASGALRAEIAFTNHGDEPAPLFEHNLPREGELRNDVFTILTEGRKAPYLGARSARGAPRRDEFLLLLPGATERRWVALHRYYQIPSGGARRAVYSAYHGDVPLFGGIFEIHSNEATF